MYFSLEEQCSRGTKQSTFYFTIKSNIKETTQHSQTIATCVVNDVMVKLEAGTFQVIKQIIREIGGTQIEIWTDFDTGLTIIKREINKAGEIVYTQILKEMR